MCNGGGVWVHEGLFCFVLFRSCFESEETGEKDEQERK